MNITEPIRRFAHLTPDAVAFIAADGSQLDYRALDRAIDAMARHAMRLGLRPGDLAGVMLGPPDPVTSMVLVLALARIGVASAPRDLTTVPLKLRFSFGASAQPGMVRFDRSWLLDPAGDAAAPVPINPDPDLLVRLFPSSGTTGEPKLIPMTHGLYGKRVATYWLGVGAARERRAFGIGFGASGPFGLALRTLWAGGAIMLPDPADLAGSLIRHGATSILLAPATMRAWLDQMPPDAGPFPALHTIEMGGSEAPRSLMAAAAERFGATVLSILGTSEGGLYAAAPASALGDRPGAAGYIFPGIVAEAVDDNGNVLPPGTEGQLRIKSPSMIPGYVGNPTETAKRFRDGWFYSGDIGTVWPDGMVALSGREQDIINIGGSKIAPGLIEEQLRTFPGATDVAAFGVRGESGMPEIWGAIAAPTPIEEDALNAFCDRWHGTFAPAVIIQVAAIPRNENGKIQRDILVQTARRLMAT